MSAMWVSRRFARSAWTVVAVLFCLAAPASQLTHGVLVAHRFCAEHLAVEDAESENGAGPTRHGEGQGEGEPNGGESHEDCWLLSLRAPCVSMTARWGDQQPVPDATPPPLPSEGAPPLASSSILAVAPKTSPPRAAHRT